ncbi:FAD-binding dehydrogenase [Rhodococcus sp. WB1]|jgi:succinate dehydrogenase/fumarate reductase flavoprotein subunit|uniref:FAD-dependent oxidoreductase n=1 Tax=Rhodococcus aetherivorans TaxID=191292 RepID=A0AA46NW08_9NOCA|nr:MULTISPECIES: FAD-dependent oxidoreductase [Rhodococcus]AKE92004.1 FAD-binding dehydrogenase [Rhodococcus aetherivorans]ANZ27735.1 FAD-binding dehydrogenase [Rhodococcus sp. WB1]MBC2589962.1 FAD-dependent oxidoreductase [Rhodococcus aetherivorans]OLL19585.1 FAD-binding dehydrogenase [Rhodococcus sp. M8]QIX52727.1 FAD-dependent oxidoreductase [Rhodococcus sp. DMU1]
MTPDTVSESLTYDVVVVGSGAGGLSTAVAAAHGGASVLVVEKADVCGGATAWSGGWMWTPRTLFAHADGVHEDRSEPRRYLEHRLGDNFDAAKVDALLDGAPEMVEFFEHHTALQFVPGAAIADIHGDTPGAGTGHRSVAPKPVSLRRLGPDVAALLRRQLYETSFLGMGIMAGPDLQAFLHSTRSGRAFLHCARRVSTHMFDLATRRRGQQLVNGTALVGRLLRSALDAGADIRVATAATALVTDPSGRVVGVRLEGPDGAYTVSARRGVVLATGGFTRDLDRRRELFPRTPTGREHWTLTPSTTTGDGISLGESVGGRLDRSLASPVAYCPVSLVRYRNGRQGVFPHILDRGKPGVIGVLADGRRFVNEALGYHDYTLAMVEQVPDGEEICSWLIADQQYLRYFPLGMAKPFPIPTWPYLRSGYLSKGRTLRELAERIGVDPDGLEKTVTAFNESARLGEDPEFGRGTTPFNVKSGDADNPWPNPSLAPLERGPFYAVKVVPGSFGTFAGLVTDSSSRVLNREDRPIDGLFAVGVDQSSVMGGHYPSGGINLGPAMTFGYLTGRRLASTTGATR